MDRELWIVVYSAIKRAARRVGCAGRTPTYPNWLIVAMYVWGNWHDRPLSWCCDRAHYGSLLRPRRLPSVSQFTRRIKSAECDAILQSVHNQLSQRGLVTDLGYIDGKPLLVSPVSKDRDARSGRISGGFGKGYKLHAFVNDRRRIVVWSVQTLNIAEQTVAAELLDHLPPLSPDALVMMDSNYDSAPLHKRAEHKGIALFNALKGQDRVGAEGHHPVTLKQMGASRRELVETWKQRPQLTRWMIKRRDEIESVLGVLVCTAGGLTCLPPWVRTKPRVRRWVGTKIILYNARLLVQETVQKEAPSLAAA